MKKNYFFKFILLMIPLSAFILMSSSTGRDDARTGSPGDGGATCTACHGGGSFGASINISTNIPGGGYETSTEYDITVNVSSSASAHGFQITAEETSGNSKVGTFVAGTGSRVTGAGKRVTHSNPNQNSWMFKWTSPSSDQGSIKFYAAGNAANGNGATSGDQIVTTSTSGFTVLGLSTVSKLNFTMFPNPSKDYLTIQLPTGVLNADVQLFDITGRLLKTSNGIASNKQIDVQDLSSGIYILKITAEGKSGTKQFIKN